MLSHSVKIKESSAEITKLIKQCIADEMNKAFFGLDKKVEQIVKKELFDAILRQPEYNSIASGSLRVELGLPDGENRLLEVIEVWLSGVGVVFNRFTIAAGKITGGMRIEAIERNYLDVIGLPSSILITEKNELLPWLHWLLLDGGSIIISDYHFSSFPGKGRTGGGIMIKGDNWSMPSIFQGTKEDNFITRAILEAIPKMESRIEAIIKSKFIG